MKYEVTMEKTIRLAFEVEAENPLYIDDAIGDYAARFDEAFDCDIEYNYAVCDEDGNTVVDWE